MAAVQEKRVDSREIYRVVLKVQDDVQTLTKQVSELTTYVTQAKALEQDRQLPARIEAQAARITTLEHALTTAKAFGYFATGLSTVLGIWQVVKALSGH